MARIPRTFIHHEQGRAINPDGSTSIFCRRCGREIMRVHGAKIRSVTECAICRLKAEGVENPEDYVLTQYVMPDPTKPPVPVDYDDSLRSGVLMLYPESVQEETGIIPQSGGVVGTVKSLFRVFSGFMGKKAEELENDATDPDKSIAKEIAKARRGTGLYGKSSARRK